MCRCRAKEITAKIGMSAAITAGLKRPYNVMDDGATQSKSVYSPIPKKYLQKGPLKTFGMVLRSRIPLKQLNGAHNLKAVSHTTKTAKDERKGQCKLGNSVIKRRVKEATKNAIETLPKRKKLEKQFNKTAGKVSTPRTAYRNRMANSPMTPDNPFLDSPLPPRRRSKRLSRSYAQDEFSNHLEYVSTGLRMLRTNSQNLQTAIGKLDNKSPIPKRLKTYDQHVGSTYKQFDDKAETKPFKRSALRRTMSRVSIKGQNLTSRFAKSASSVQAWKNGYGEMVSSPIRG